MRTRTPTVSIGLPVYNGAQFIGDAIKSVQRQDFDDWELVIVDNASTDQTHTICMEFAHTDERIRVYKNQRNLGFCRNFNLTFQLSEGTYFGWLAYDDIIGPEFMRLCIAELQRNEGTVLVFPRITYIDRAGASLARQHSADLSIVAPSASERVRILMEMEMHGTDIYWAIYGLANRITLMQTRLHALYNGSDQTLLLEIVLSGNVRQIGHDLFFRRCHEMASTLRRGWTATERAKFAYSDDRRFIVFPYCRMLQEHVSIILRSDMPFRGKAACVGAIFRRFSGQWKYFVEEFVYSPLDALRIGRRTE